MEINSENINYLDWSATKCRICLSESADQYISIFDDILDVQISDLITEISQMPMCLSDHLSQLICTPCCVDLQTAIRIRRSFLRSEAYFLDVITHSKSPIVHHPNNDPFLVHNCYIEFVDKPDDKEVADYQQDQTDVDEIKSVNEIESRIEDFQLPKTITIKTETLTTQQTDGLKKDYELPKSLTIRQLPTKMVDRYMSSENLTWADLGEKDFTKKREHIRDGDEIYFGKNAVEIDRKSVLTIPESKLKYSCCMCYNLSETEEELIAHLYTHPERAKRSEFQKNIEQAIPGQPRMRGKKKCIKCIKTYSIGRFDLHLKAFYTEKKFQCKSCGVCFGFYQKLKSHEGFCRKSKNVEPEEYICDVCQRKCTSRGAIIEHLKLHTMTDEDRIKFKCNICGHGFPTVRRLKAHVQLHSTIKTKNCTICEKQFRTVTQLSAHLRVHNNDRSYQCSYCEKSYIQCTDKKRHEMSVHTGKTISKQTFNLKFKKTFS
jgi:hypothetical protein